MNFDLSKLMEQAKQMQEELKSSHDELAKISIDAEAGAGMVKIKANAKPEIINIKIEDDLLKMNDKEMIEDLIKAAVNSVLEKAKNKSEDLMRNKTGDLMSKIDLTNFGYKE